MDNKLAVPVNADTLFEALPGTTTAVPVPEPTPAQLRAMHAAEVRAQREVRRQQKAITPPKTQRAFENWVHNVDLELFEWDLTAAPKGPVEPAEPAN